MCACAIVTSGADGIMWDGTEHRRADRARASTRRSEFDGTTSYATRTSFSSSAISAKRSAAIGELRGERVDDDLDCVCRANADRDEGVGRLR